MIVEYQAGHGILHRAHPFTNLTLVGSVAVLAFVLPAPGGPLVLGAALVTLAIAAGLARILLPAAVVVAPFWGFLLLIHGLLGGEPLRALTFGGRIGTMVLGFLMLLVTIHPARLVDALVARRVPFAFAYLLSATLQAVPRLRDRGRQILEAQRCRGLRVRGSLFRRIGAIVPLTVPLVLGALAEVDDRAMALESRGGGRAVRRTPLDPPVDTMADRSARWVMAVGTLVAVLLQVLK
jgi:energy-coupling factor transport system permease protein